MTAARSKALLMYGALGHSGTFLFAKASEKSYKALSSIQEDHK